MLAMPAAWNRISRARGRGRFSHSRGVWMMVSADIPSSAAIRANHIICVTSLSLFTVRRHWPRRPAGPSGGRFRVIAQLVLIHLAVDAVHEVGNGLGVQVGDGVAHGGGETVGFVVRPVDLLKILLCPRAIRLWTSCSSAVFSMATNSSPANLVTTPYSPKAFLSRPAARISAVSPSACP